MKGRKPSEKTFTEDTIQFAQALGWRVAHFRSVETKRQGWITPVAGDGKGFLDLTMVRERVLWVELKFGKNKLSPEQVVWRDWLIAAGQEVYVWYPEDVDEMMETLRRRQPHPVHSGV